MADAIDLRDKILAKARAAVDAGKARDDHNFNWHSNCLPDYLSEYDSYAASKNKSTPNGAKHIDSAQVLP